MKIVNIINIGNVLVMHGWKSSLKITDKLKIKLVK